MANPDKIRQQIDEGKGGDKVTRSASPATLSAGIGRGRTAETPTEFGPLAWKDILVRTFREAIDDDLMTVAAAITFFGLLALFPAIAALVSLYALIADPSTIRGHLNELAFLLPPNTFSIVEDQIKRVIEQGGTELGVKFVLSLAFSFWSANAGMKAMISGLNVAYDEKEKRSFVWLTLVSAALTGVALIGLMAIVGLTSIIPEIFAEGSSTATSVGLSILRWPLMLVFLSLGLSALYRFGPSRTEAQWRWVTWGGALASLLIVFISVLLAWYLTNLADYNKTYGSLGAMIGLMTWIWLTCLAVLIGAELNAEMEHQTARDSTTGVSKPLGARGAKMADTVGKAAD